MNQYIDRVLIFKVILLTDQLLNRMLLESTMYLKDLGLHQSSTSFRKSILQDIFDQYAFPNGSLTFLGFRIRPNSKVFYADTVFTFNANRLTPIQLIISLAI